MGGLASLEAEHKASFFLRWRARRVAKVSRPQYARRPVGHTDAAGLALGSSAGRWVLAATVLGSGMAALDATVVNVALPAIGRDLGTGVEGLQWALNGYLLTLASLILLGGSLGDRYGRRRVFMLGATWFAAASL